MEKSVSDIVSSLNIPTRTGNPEYMANQLYRSQSTVNNVDDDEEFLTCIDQFSATGPLLCNPDIFDF